MKKTELEVSSNININQEQIIQVVVSEVEERLITQRDILAKEVIATDKELELLKTSIHKEQQAFFKSKEQKEAEVLAKALEKFTGQSVVVKFSSRIEPEFEEKSALIIGTTTIASKSERSHYSNSEVSKESKHKIPSSLKKNMDKKVKLSDLVNNLSRELITVKKSLNDIPRYERRAKASLAASTLSTTAEGSKVLSDLRKSVIDNDSFLKALPSG